MLSQEIQYFITGLSIGSVYALVALGFTIIHTVTGIVNFAQGEFVMLGGMVAYFLFRFIGLPLWAAAPLSIAAVTVVGLLLQRIAIRSARQASIVSLIVITIGASILIRGLVGQFWVWGREAVRLPYFTGEQSLSFLGAAVHPQKLLVLGITIALMVLFHLLLSRTPLGKALRACAINKRAAGMVGVDARAMSLFSFGAAAALGAVGGILIASQAVTSYDSGVMLGLKGFLAACMGGLSSQMGAVLGGLGLGLLESFGAGHISSAWKEAFSLSVFLLFLIVRARRLPASEVEH
ncbi:MAG: branched-chain amino acid ABC transporter permease [Chloroflexota bacterium]